MHLIDIQKLQFSDKPAAEAMMLTFLRENEDPSIKEVELRPRPESLNSINGFINYQDGERLFFKTHVEENEQLSEYYNASMLANAGYPVISAKQITHRPGKQIVLYEIVTLPTLFDLLKEEEDAEIGGPALSNRALLLLDAQKQLDKKVFAIYENTMKNPSVDERVGDAPVNQLFYHRLAEDGRLGLFYRGKSIQLEDSSLNFDDLAKMKWIINGVSYSETIEQIIKRCREILAPAAGLTIVGHGDAHNGNIFVDLEQRSLSMFDPAFAGVHDPLLDLTKPLFHNIFARWMYFPEQVSQEFSLSYKIAEGEISIEHDFFPSRLRLDHLKCKQEYLIRPTLELRNKREWTNGYRPDNRVAEYLHSALFCCPFLTVNLFATPVSNGTLSERYSLPIKLLGLSMAVALGAVEHQGTNQMTDLVDALFEI